MAWIYLAESADFPWHYPNGSTQLLTAKATDTRKPYSCLGCETEVSPDDQFGMTCEPCAETLSYQALWKSFMADSPARICQLQELVAAWQESEADFIGKSKGLSEKQTRDSYFSKTSQQLELGASTLSSSHLQSSGMIVDGRLYQPPKLAAHTCAKDGFSWPTPKASEATRGASPAEARRKSPSLSSIAVGMWATPMARDHKDRLSAVKHGTHSPSIAIEVNQIGQPGYLNPRFLEAIMGYPPGWTELADWAMQWFRSKRKSRSKDCVA